MNKEVILSILAMDSYQRGYAPGIKDIAGNRIGQFSIGLDSTQYSETVSGQDQGFYALSYVLDESWAGIPAGTTVISYRGTDFDSGIQLFRDVTLGWSSFTGFGSPTQFSLALDFYRAVTGIDITAGNVPVRNDIITTGHSLGGGLAGANDNWVLENVA